MQNNKLDVVKIRKQKHQWMKHEMDEMKNEKTMDNCR